MNKINRLYLRQLFREGVNTPLTPLNTLFVDAMAPWAFANECLMKTKGPNDKVKFGAAYQAYLTFCQNDGKKEFEKKSDFKKVLKDLAYKIDNSKVDGNQVYIFNARVVEVNE